MVENILNNKTNLLLTIVMLILLVFNISLLNYKILTPIMQNNDVKKQYEADMAQIEQEKEQANVKDDAWSEEELQKIYINDLKSMGEAERMQTYLYNYIGLIESEKYEEAFEMLYDDFKNQYFHNVDEYIQYVQNRYPVFMSVEYNDIERQGEYYILTVTIRNAVPTEDSDALKQRFIMHEKGINEYEISFQVM